MKSTKDCEDMLLKHHLALKSLLEGQENLLRLNEFDETSRDELEIQKDRIEELVDESWKYLQEHRVMETTDAG